MAYETTPQTDDPATIAATLAQWEADEQARRTRFSDAGVPRPEQVKGLSGQQVFDGMFDGSLPPPPIGQTMDFVPMHMEHGVAVFQGRPQLRHYNPLGTVHGGWIATLLDSCLGCAVHTTLPAGKAYTTAELKVNYVRAVTSKVPLVRAIGRIIHAGGRMATADARLIGPDGKLYAHASTTCFIFDAP